MAVGETILAVGAGERPASFAQFSAAIDPQWIASTPDERSSVALKGYLRSHPFRGAIYLVAAWVGAFFAFELLTLAAMVLFESLHLRPRSAALPCWRCSGYSRCGAPPAVGSETWSRRA